MAAKKKSKIMQIIDNFIDSLSEEEKAEILEGFDYTKEDNFSAVTMQEWSETHPYELASGSDSFYVKFANDFQHKISKFAFQFKNTALFKKELAMAYAAYLEDFVSDLRVWPTLRGFYKERYGATLPFYDCSHENYFEDDINIEDLKMLTWQVFCRVGQEEGKIYSPYSPGVDKLSKIGYEMMVDCIEDAPANMRAKTTIVNILRENDYFEIRELGYWLSVNNKLTSVYWEKENLEKQINTNLNTRRELFSDSQIDYMFRVIYSWQDYISFMGCATKELLSRYAKNFGYDVVAKMVAGIKKQMFSSYDITDINKKYITLANANGEEFKLLRNSIPSETPLNDGVKSVTTSIVLYGDYWMQNGLAAFSYTTMDKNKAKERLSDPRPKVEFIRELIKKNKGRRIFYLKTLDEVNQFFGINPAKENVPDTMIGDNYLVMLSEEKGVSIVPDICWIFKDKANPFFDSSIDVDSLADRSLEFISESHMPDDVAEYIQEKKLLPYASIYASQGKRLGKKVVQENMRFLFGFYRVANEDVSSENQ